MFICKDFNEGKSTDSCVVSFLFTNFLSLYLYLMPYRLKWVKNHGYPQI